MGVACCKEEPVDLLGEGSHYENKPNKETYLSFYCHSRVISLSAITIRWKRVIWKSSSCSTQGH
jgi:hypothetical protein